MTKGNRHIENDRYWVKLRIANASDITRAYDIIKRWADAGLPGKRRFKHFKEEDVKVPSWNSMCKNNARCFFFCANDTDKAKLKEMLDKERIKRVLTKTKGDHSIKLYDEKAIRLFEWMIARGPAIEYVKTVSRRVKPAVIRISGNRTVSGMVLRVRGCKKNDRFYLDIFGDKTYVMFPIDKGSALQYGQTAFRKAGPAASRMFDGMVWIVFAGLTDKEINVEYSLRRYFEKAKNKWIADNADSDKLNDDMPELVTYLPLEDRKVSESTEARIKKERDNALAVREEPVYNKDNNIEILNGRTHAKLRDWNENSVRWKKLHKRLVIKGYLFARMNHTFYMTLEKESKPIYGLRLRSHILRENGLPVIVPDVMMQSFINTVDEETIRLNLDDKEYTEGETVRFLGSDEHPHMKGYIGSIVRRRNRLYLAFNPLGGLMSSVKAIAVTAGQVRKLTKKEIKELGIKQ